MDNPPIIPDFQLIRRVGGGSYGDVWLVRSVTGIYRAIKIVDRSRFTDDRPFLREFDGITRFQKAVGSQPRQLALLHVGRDDAAGILYYVMELADDALAGTDIDPATYVPLTLKELRLRRGVLPPEECVQIGTELASALDGLHEAGLIHRDVKPSNIIFVNRLAKLADVGLIASSEHTLTSIGTPGYAPPEGSGTASADIYSLGKIIYELSTGLSPSEFPRLPPGVLTQAGTPSFLELNEIILRACDPEFARRYVSARQMLDELLLLKAGRSVKELNRMRRRIRFVMRAGVVASALCAVVVGVLAIKNYYAMKQIAAQEVALSSQARVNERFAHYTSDLHLAQLALAKEDFGEARTALRQDIPTDGQIDIRGFEWYALWNETAGDQATLFGANGGPPVCAVALSPDGAFLATQEGSTLGNTILWDRNEHTRRIVAKETFRLGGFTPDGGRLTVGTANHQIYQIDLASGKPLPTQPISGLLIQSSFDGRTLLVLERGSTNAGLFLWDIVKQRKTAEWHYHGRVSNVTLSAAALSPDGHLLAVSVFWAEGLMRNREVIVYSIQSGLEQFRTDKLPQVQALRFSPDSLQLAIAMRGPIAILNALTGAETKRFVGHSGTVSALEFSKNGRLLASGGSDQKTRVWDLVTGQQQHAFRGHEGGIRALTWLGDKEQVISAADDGTTRVWSVPTPNSARTIHRFWPDAFGDFLFSSNGEFVAVTAATGCICFLDTGTMTLCTSTVGAFQPLAFSSDGKSLWALSAEQRLVRCDVSKGAVEPLALSLAGTDKLVAIASSATGVHSAFVYEDKQIEIWDLPQQTRVGFVSPAVNKIGAVAWAPQDSVIAVGDRFGRIVVCPINGSGVNQELPRQPAGIFSLAYSSDGKWLAIGREDGALSLWNLASKRMETTFHAHGALVNHITFSPDNSRLITAGHDGNILIWTVNPLKQITVLRGESTPSEDRERFIASIKFDRTAQHLGVLMKDGRFKLWNLRP